VTAAMKKEALFASVLYDSPIGHPALMERGR
jgi:hypothetical protein